MPHEDANYRGKEATGFLKIHTPRLSVMNRFDTGFVVACDVTNDMALEASD